MAKTTLKEVFKAQADKDAVFQAALAAIKGAPFKSLFGGINFKTIIHQACKILVAIRDTYCSSQGITKEELIDTVAQYLDDKISLPIYVEPFDKMVFAFILDLGMDLIDKNAETIIEVAAVKVSMIEMFPVESVA